MRNNFVNFCLAVFVLSVIPIYGSQTASSDISSLLPKNLHDENGDQFKTPPGSLVNSLSVSAEEVLYQSLRQEFETYKTDSEKKIHELQEQQKLMCKSQDLIGQINLSLQLQTELVDLRKDFSEKLEIAFKKQGNESELQLQTMKTEIEKNLQHLNTKYEALKNRKIYGHEVMCVKLNNTGQVELDEKNHPKVLNGSNDIPVTVQSNLNEIRSFITTPQPNIPAAQIVEDKAQIYANADAYSGYIGAVLTLNSLGRITGLVAPFARAVAPCAWQVYSASRLGMIPGFSLGLSKLCTGIAWGTGFCYGVPLIVMWFLLEGLYDVQERDKDMRKRDSAKQSLQKSCSLIKNSLWPTMQAAGLLVVLGILAERK